jgi:hypothetical protein
MHALNTIAINAQPIFPMKGFEKRSRLPPVPSEERGMQAG